MVSETESIKCCSGSRADVDCGKYKTPCKCRDQYGYNNRNKETANNYCCKQNSDDSDGTYVLDR